MDRRPTGPSPSPHQDRKSTRLNSSHGYISYAVFCLKKKLLALLQKGSLDLDALLTQRLHVSCAPAPLGARPLSVTGVSPSVPPSEVDDFFFNDTATTEIYTLSLHDALPI